MKTYCLLLAVGLLLAAPARAQKVPHVGYVFPAGGQRGTTVTVSIGGQYLQGVDAVYLSGEGIEAKVVKHIKPMPQMILNQLRQKRRELTTQVRDKELTEQQAGEQFVEFAKSKGQPDITPESFKELDDNLRDPKRQENAQLEEQVIVELAIADTAPLGERELRLKTPRGLTNPLLLQVGQYPEYIETSTDDDLHDVLLPTELPVVINGQILPGDVDRYRFHARRRTQLVASVEARSLIPYLADAVPGWFQATLSLQDVTGAEGAYSDDDAFDPDPVLYINIPQTADYVLEIHDAIYRGREDFVYRITVGEVPHVTSVFPLGCRTGKAQLIRVDGHNLPAAEKLFNAAEAKPGVVPMTVMNGDLASNPVPMAVGDLPEMLESEPNNTPAEANKVALPIVVNGQIRKPGDEDVYAFEGKQGQEIVAEVHARRLDSALDSLLKLLGPDGELLAANDDFEDRGAGLTTHQADSLIRYTLPQEGTYHLVLSDTQVRGGTNYAYRLRLSAPQPDFALRVVPSSLTVAAGNGAPITVYAIRHDGYEGPIELRLADMPEGFALTSKEIPAGEEKLELTLRTPRNAGDSPVSLSLEGSIETSQGTVTHQAVPADDQMQAFLYRHLTPAHECLIQLTGKPRRNP